MMKGLLELSKKNKVKFPLGPIRMCVCCNDRHPKNEMVRLGVVDHEICQQQKGVGRGVYVCPQHSPAQINKKRKRIFHLLRCKGEYDISLSSSIGVVK